jgi:hypothetical protein
MLQRLRALEPTREIILLWDGAPYRRAGAVAILSPQNWQSRNCH